MTSTPFTCERRKCMFPKLPWAQEWRKCVIELGATYLWRIYLWRPHGREVIAVLKFVPCLRILLFLNNRSTVHSLGWRKVWGIAKLINFYGRHKCTTPSARNISNGNFVFTLISWIFNPHSKVISVRFTDIHNMYLNILALWNIEKS